MIGTLVLSAAGFIGIAQWEAFRSTTYNDSAGNSTYGFGTTAGVKPGDKITVERALVVALADAQKHGEAIKKCIKVPLFQYEWDSYVSATYNIGATAFCHSTLLKKLNAGDYIGACNELSRWVKARGKTMKGLIKLRGLVKRRAAERQMCFGKVK